MKKRFALFIATALVVSLAACSNGNETGNTNPTEQNNNSAVIQSGDPAGNQNSGSENGGNADEPGSNILIAYFSMPEDVDVSGVDAVTGASVVVKDGQKMGDVESVAKLVQQTIGGDLFRIETVQQYPLEHDPLLDHAADERDNNARPELAAQIENLDQYDTIILGYPNWWADLPMPLYTFLEEYDLGGKTIIPFVTHGGSGFSRTRDTIADLQPNAQVSDNTLSLSRNHVADSENEVVQWAESLK